MNPLDYHKPDRANPAARPGFRFGAWVLFAGSLLTVGGALVALAHGHYGFAVPMLLGVLAGVWMFGRIAIAGRL